MRNSRKGETPSYRKPTKDVTTTQIKSLESSHTQRLASLYTEKKFFLSLKLAKKIPKNKRSKKRLDGLYDLLAPGSSVFRSNEHTLIIKEAGKRKVTIRKFDLAKIGAKTKRQADLKDYTDRRP